MSVMRCLKCGKQLTNMDISTGIMLSYLWCDNCNIDYYIRDIGGNKETSYINIQMIWSK